MAGDSMPADGQSFSTTVGLLYVFNLIVGTGALALPRAFQAAGYVLSVFLLFISAFTSYICATFVLESLAIANCVLRRQRKGFTTAESATESGTPVPEDPQQHQPPQQQTTALADEFAITRRIELSEMAHMFLGRVGTLFAYVVLVIYLFGDLAVYSTTVPKSLMNVLCSSLNASAPSTNISEPCHSREGDLLHSLSRFAVYQLCIVVFVLFCFPMVLMGMTRTKWLQLATTLSRWTAFFLMIVLASLQLAQDGAKGSPPPADFHGFGSLFGVAVYAFMCHHSVPGLVTPIRQKANLGWKLMSVYVLVYLFYCALSTTGAFAFRHVQDIYTINFLHDEQTGGFWNSLADYFLALFPVFVLTSSYIIVAITLCNNIRALISLIQGNSSVTGGDSADDGRRLVDQSQTEESEALLGDDEQPVAIDHHPQQQQHGGSHGQEEVPINFHPQSSSTGNLLHSSSTTSLNSPAALFRQFGVPALVVLLPSVLSMCTDNVLLLASITGSFPGVGVQYVLPALLVLGARRALSFRVGYTASLPPGLRSPFAHWLWPFGILCWAIFAVVVVSANIFHLG